MNEFNKKTELRVAPKIKTPVALPTQGNSSALPRANAPEATKDFAKEKSSAQKAPPIAQKK